MLSGLNWSIGAYQVVLLYRHFSCFASCPYSQPIAMYGSPFQSGGVRRVLFASPPMRSAYLRLSSSRVVIRSPFGFPVLWGNPWGNA